MKLIKMTTFVKEQSRIIGTTICYINCLNYATFLETELELKMFIACDIYGNPINPEHCDPKIYEQQKKPIFKNIKANFSRFGLGHVSFGSETIWNVGMKGFWFKTVEDLLELGIELTDYGIEQLNLNK